MRAAFAEALHFAKTERRGGSVPIIEHQSVGYALADAKAAIEACRAMSWSALRAFDANASYALELGLQTKIFTSETAVKTITNLMLVVGMESYDHSNPLAMLLQDSLAMPLFDGGNMGVRRRHIHRMLRAEDYDPLAVSGLT
jgi:alkylation response protein AidB-like acyl-CoA dehydrogenase